ncbi:MAG: thiamine-phosphate kinase [Gemmatimonadaceae bacterium]
MPDSTSHVSMATGVEFDAIRRMLALWGDRAHGIGDDAAVLSVRAEHKLVASTDACVEDVHFRRGWLTAEEIGGRAAAAALSDLAAMAASPVGLLLALALPSSWRAELDALALGVARVASSVGCPIVGGNISASDKLALTITVLGDAEHPLRRSGAREGDSIFVTGRLGGPGEALVALLEGRTPAAAHLVRFASPSPRIREAAWLSAHGATSAIDISDGLMADAAHVARASGVSLDIDARLVPLMDDVSTGDALMSGEEYELIVTLPADTTVDPAAFEREFGTPLTRIGLVRVAEHDAGAGAFKGHDHLGP